MLVDEENDIMCFMTVRTQPYEPEHWHRLRWMNFPEALKMHDSIYNTIHTQSLDPSFEFLEVSFRQEAFNAEPDFYDPAIDYYFKSNFSTIFEYNKMVMNNFFWTSTDTTHFFESASTDTAHLNEDKQRHLEWVKMFDQVMEAHENADRAYEYEDNADVCKFDSLYELTEYQPVSQYNFF